jgi:hypothetical protein
MPGAAAARKGGTGHPRRGYARVAIDVDRESDVDRLRVSLVFEVALPSRPAAVLARLAVDLSDGSALVAVEPIGGEVARLLACETLAVPGFVAWSALVDKHPAVPKVEPELPAEPLTGGEVEQLAEPLPGGDETPEVLAGECGPQLDESRHGTDHAAQVEPPERVVVYVDGRWRDGLVISRD